MARLFGKSFKILKRKDRSNYSFLRLDKSQVKNQEEKDWQMDYGNYSEYD